MPWRRKSALPDHNIVIPNLFRDNALWLAVLKQVQDDEGFDDDR
jgi:hypothetical protein